METLTIIILSLTITVAIPTLFVGLLWVAAWVERDSKEN